VTVVVTGAFAVQIEVAADQCAELIARGDATRTPTGLYPIG
jgi:hypothetical protein